jgi:hypothetical protein
MSLNKSETNIFAKLTPRYLTELTYRLYFLALCLNIRNGETNFN